MQNTFQLKARFFKNTAGGNILRKGFGENPDNIRMLKYMAAGLLYRARSKAPAPIRLADIITQLGGSGVDIVTAEHADAANKHVRCLDRKRERFLLIRR